MSQRVTRSVVTGFASKVNYIEKDEESQNGNDEDWRKGDGDEISWVDSSKNDSCVRSQGDGTFMQCDIKNSIAPDIHVDEEDNFM